MQKFKFPHLRKNSLNFILANISSNTIILKKLTGEEKDQCQMVHDPTIEDYTQEVVVYKSPDVLFSSQLGHVLEKLYQQKRQALSLGLSNTCSFIFKSLRQTY